MDIGFPEVARLTRTRDMYLFQCEVTGLDLHTRYMYRDVLDRFIQFIGDILVKELTPVHVRMYIAHLAEYPSKGRRHTRLMAKQYAVIRTWIRWLFAQKAITERLSNVVKPPPLKTLFPLRLEMA